MLHLLCGVPHQGAPTGPPDLRGRSRDGTVRLELAHNGVTYERGQPAGLEGQPERRRRRGRRGRQAGWEAMPSRPPWLHRMATGAVCDDVHALHRHQHGERRTHAGHQVRAPPELWRCGVHRFSPDHWARAWEAGVGRLACRCMWCEAHLRLDHARRGHRRGHLAHGHHPGWAGGPAVCAGAPLDARVPLRAPSTPSRPPCAHSGPRGEPTPTRPTAGICVSSHLLPLRSSSPSGPFTSPSPLGVGCAPARCGRCRYAPCAAAAPLRRPAI